MTSATITRNIPTFNNSDIVDGWEMEDTTAEVKIIRPEDSGIGGLELRREDTGETILIPFNERSEWTILASIPDPESEGQVSPPLVFNPFSVGGILALNQLAEHPASQQAAGEWLETIREWRRCIKEIHANDPSLVLPESITTILSETYFDTVRPVGLPDGITAGGLGRLIMANTLKMEIDGLRNGNEKVAKPTLEWLGDMVDDWQPMPGSRFRQPIVARAHMGSTGAGWEERVTRQLARANDTLVREIFRKLTISLPENITAAMHQGPADDLARQLVDSGAIEITADGTQEWGKSVTEHLQDVLGRSFRGTYKPECRLFATTNEQDVLLVSDHAGSYFYSWPTASRAPVIDTLDGKAVIAALAEQIPTPEEVMQLKEEHHRLATARDLANEALHDSPPDEPEEDIRPSGPRLM